MRQIPEALAPLAAHRQFMLYKKVPSPDRPGKTDKFPCSMLGQVVSAHDAEHWIDADTACNIAGMFGEPYGVAFVFTENDPFFFVDIDDCLVGNDWSDKAKTVLAQFPGAAVEVSQSGRGLHIIGCNLAPIEHRSKNHEIEADLYTAARFVALTGDRAIGSAAVDLTAEVHDAVAKWWGPKEYGTEGWTTEPVEGYHYLENGELISRALSSVSTASRFGSAASFADIWNNNVEALAKFYPSDQRPDEPDYSAVDGALVSHLAFWTGKNCERVRELMLRSSLVRDKWERPGYLETTIERFVAMQEAVYTQGDTVEDNTGLPKLKGSAAQKEYGASIRAAMMAPATEQQKHAVLEAPPMILEASFWINNKDKTLDEILQAVKPVECVEPPKSSASNEAQIRVGYQYLGAPQQLDFFKGCVYVLAENAVLAPNGMLLKSEVFNCRYGGYEFAITEMGKTTRKAWDAFTQSQLVKFPYADDTCFRPDLPFGEIVQYENEMRVNTYLPVKIKRKQGDASIFLNHLAKLIPNKSDREQVLCFMAAIAQHPGKKFQWAPLIQGVEGNGKSTLSWCVMHAVGQTYTHLPKASEIGEKFNDWQFGKLFIAVEDIYVPDSKRELLEILKPMITGKVQPCRAMQKSETNKESFANFIFNSNHKDAIRKTRNDRRFGVYYCAQQTKAHLARDGMDGKYFRDLNNWLDFEDGYAIVSELLHTYPIPDELNPALGHIAPETSSTEEAFTKSMGGFETEILDKIEEGAAGFKGGWISSVAIDGLVAHLRRENIITRTKRKEILADMGYILHPALPQGRPNNRLRDGTRPKLYILEGHICLNETKASKVVEAYEKAQSEESTTVDPIAARHFTNG